MQGDIFIIGQIGSGFDEQGNFVRGVELVDVIAQFRAIPETQKEIKVVIESPGGLVSTGDAIYNYLESKKKEGYKITTIQRGIVGSIATKIFLSGDSRVVNQAEEFFIHNPLVQNLTGDANLVQAVANQLQDSKEVLLDFYSQKTGNNREALEPLMDSETSLTADQAVALGFATEKINQEKVYASITKNMDFKQLLAEIKAMLPGPAPVKAMELKLASGQMISTSAADLDSLAGSDTNAPDGEHELEDGRMIVVAGGKITEVKAKKMPEEQYVSVAQFNEFATSVKDALAAVKAIKESTDAQLVDIKNQIVGKHTPPKKKENANQPLGGELAKEWDDMMKKDGVILKLKKENPARYKEMFVAKYGTEPNME